MWVDPQANAPLVIETTFHLGEVDVPATLSDFRIDPPLDDSLFRLDPPAGYALKKVNVPVKIGEEALVDMLRQYAEASGGAFPPKLDDMAAFRKASPKEKWTGPDDPRMIRLTQSVAAATVFLRLELKGAYGYAPVGVKLGDAKKAVFWYRPKGAAAYRAVFGDLHVEDVDADRLPEKPEF